MDRVGSSKPLALSIHSIGRPGDLAAVRVRLGMEPYRAIAIIHQEWTGGAFYLDQQLKRRGRRELRGGRPPSASDRRPGARIQDDGFVLGGDADGVGDGVY